MAAEAFFFFFFSLSFSPLAAGLPAATSRLCGYQFLGGGGGVKEVNAGIYNYSALDKVVYLSYSVCNQDISCHPLLIYRTPSTYSPLRPPPTARLSLFPSSHPRYLFYCLNFPSIPFRPAARQPLNGRIISTGGRAELGLGKRNGEQGTGGERGQEKRGLYHIRIGIGTNHARRDSSSSGR